MAEYDRPVGIGALVTVDTTVPVDTPAVVAAVRACCDTTKQPGLSSPGKNVSMLYMVVERYLSGPEPVYERAAARGRMLPEGLEYISSWVSADGDMDRCFQLMETSDPALFDVWLARWNDLVSFEVYPVITSAEAAARTGTRPP